jgi:predicted nucleic acid-binding protein
MSAIFLAKELDASPVLLDDYRARKLAKAEGLEILGSVGLLETFYLRRYLTPLSKETGMSSTVSDSSSIWRAL